MPRPWSMLLTTLALAFACAPGAAVAAVVPPATTPTVTTPAARPALPTLKLEKIGGLYYAPTYVAAAPADPHRIFVVEKGGAIRTVVDGVRQRRPFLDIHTMVFSTGEERGMLSMAFDPDYAASGRVYVAYTALDGAVTVDEYHRMRGDPNVADPATRRLVFRQPHPNHNHNSGQLQFGPDGKLYIGVGDGGGAGDRRGNAQNLGVDFGKILRVDPRPGNLFIPPDNPFVQTPGARPEVYAYGFRNPWRFSFDKASGDLAIADVGQDQVEEIDFARAGQAAGQNYGWNRCEGTQRFGSLPGLPQPCDFPTSVPPEIQHRHSDGYCAAIGGYVVRDRSLGSLYGRYVYGDWCKAGLRTAVLGAPPALRDDRRLGVSVPALTGFGQDAGGCVYAASFDGTVSRLTLPPAKASTSTAARAAAPVVKPGYGKLPCMPVPQRVRPSVFR